MADLPAFLKAPPAGSAAEAMPYVDHDLLLAGTMIVTGDDGVPRQKVLLRVVVPVEPHAFDLLIDPDYAEKAGEALIRHAAKARAGA